VAGRSDESRVLVVGHWKSADEVFAQVDAMNGALVILGVRGAHQKVTGRNPGEIGGRCERHRPSTSTLVVARLSAHLTERRQYSPGLNERSRFKTE